MLRVTVLCSDPHHPVNAILRQWSSVVKDRAEVIIVRTVAETAGGDLLFLVSCHEIVEADVRRRYRHALVLHASALPECRGMSPHVWQILQGRTELTMSLLTAEDKVDSGAIWRQVRFEVPRTAVFEEINSSLFSAEMDLMTWAIDHCDEVQPRPQSGNPTYCRRRTPADSEIDPSKSLADSFDAIRVADPHRYPAYFTLQGRKFRISIEPIT